MDAVKNAGHEGKIKFAIDPASSEFYSAGKYDVGFKSQKPCQLAAMELNELYQSLMNKYPVILLEDPFAEDDWAAWSAFKKNCPIELVGDDLLATNIERIEIAKERDACNSLLLKINQIGTVTESLQAYAFMSIHPGLHSIINVNIYLGPGRHLATAGGFLSRTAQVRRRTTLLPI